MSKYKIKTLTNNFCKDVICLKWRITYTCNYHCPYCIQIKQGLKGYNGALLEEETEKLFSLAEKIDPFLSRVNPENKDVVLEVIGGEVTLIDLISLMEKIKDKNIKKLNITTNGSKPIDYFYFLANYLHERGIKLIITMSFHDSQTTFSEYMYKAEKIKALADEFSCEYVSRLDNQETVKQFISVLEEKGIDYKIEPNKNKDHLSARMRGELIATSNFTNRGLARYNVVLEDEKGNEIEKSYDCLAELLNDKDNASVVSHKVILPEGMYCTEGYSYFYLQYDGSILGGTKESPRCDTKTPIDDFVPLEKPLKCQFSACSCCGYMSLYKELPEEFNIANTEEC